MVAREVGMLAARGGGLRMGCARVARLVERGRRPPCSRCYAGPRADATAHHLSRVGDAEAAGGRIHDSLRALYLESLSRVDASEAPSMADAERRVPAATALCSDEGQRVVNGLYALLGDRAEPIRVLVAMTEILIRAALDFERAASSRLPDFHAYPSAHPYAESPPDRDGHRLLLENREYQTTRFRRMHVEVGARSDGNFEVLHVVLYPRARYALPIFCLDVVAFGGRVSFAIADASPVGEGEEGGKARLPAAYAEAMASMRARHLPDVTMEGLPPWAHAILSPHAVCVRPKTEADVRNFAAYCSDLLSWHLDRAAEATLLSRDATIGAVFRSHERFAYAQRTNLKTTRMLDAAFGPAFGQAYVNGTLFDVEESWECGEEGGEEGGEGWREGKEGAVAAVESAEGRQVYVRKGEWKP